MTLQEIQELIKILNKSNIAELRLERDDVKLTLRTKDYWDGRFTPAPPVVLAAAPAPTVSYPHEIHPSTVSSLSVAGSTHSPSKTESSPTENDSDLITIKSPMIGTFYRSNGPEKDPFVGVGDTIKPGQVICIIEAMKLFNEIESEVAGKIVKIMIDNATPVEYDQPLFLIDPKG